MILVCGGKAHIVNCTVATRAEMTVVRVATSSASVRRRGEGNGDVVRCR
jgi:hypothetical protein